MSLCCLGFARYGSSRDRSPVAGGIDSPPLLRRGAHAWKTWSLTACSSPRFDAERDRSDRKTAAAWGAGLLGEVPDDVLVVSLRRGYVGGTRGLDGCPARLIIGDECCDVRA